MSDITFNDLVDNAQLREKLASLGIETPTPIQALSIPKIKEGLDIIGQAQTGTGKTFSYGLPLLEKIDQNSNKIQALILCPTRELAKQVSNELEKVLPNKSKIKTVTIYGGESYTKQFDALRKGPQIVIGAPGRIIDLIDKKKIDFSNLNTLILDEADEMLNMGFKEDLEQILKSAPTERQTILFSATLPATIKQISKNYQKDPLFLQVKAQTLTVDRIEQKVYFCYKESKKDLLIRVLDFYNFNSVIMFCNTKACVDELVMLLQSFGYSVDGLHGDLKQQSRDRVMNAYRSGAIKILIATDVAARGLDINNIEGVINYDLPTDDEVYVHRIGRTGRAGKTGTAISIVTPRQKNRINEISRYTKSKMAELPVPTVEQIKSQQSSLIYTKLSTLLQKNADINESNLEIVNKLVKDGYDPSQIVNALIDSVYYAEGKTYPEILNQGHSRDRNRDRNDRSGSGERKDARRARSKDFICVHMNVGKNEGMRPQILLSYLDKDAKVRKDNVGDIVIRKSGTSFEITKTAFSYLIKLQGKKYKDVRINISKKESLNVE
ncbi:MAG: DEAD/DEAH box helicase [bacterium]